MATLNFRLENGDYCTEITAQDAVNVQIKRNEAGSLVVYQRGSANGDWVDTKAYSKGVRKSFDFNLVSDYYPMNWRIESSCEVISATLNE